MTDTFWRKVVKAESITGPMGGLRWRLILDCGHVIETQRPSNGYHEERKLCWECETEKRERDLEPKGFPRKWETVHKGKLGGTQRLKVHGGWIVERWVRIEHLAELPGKVESSMVFVPDPNHAWVLEKEEEPPSICALSLKEFAKQTELSVRARRLLGLLDGTFSSKAFSVNCETVGDLCRLGFNDLLEYRNIGETTVIEIQTVLKKHGLSLLNYPDQQGAENAGKRKA